MTLFRYEAFSSVGQRVDGVVESASLTDALTHLTRQGLTPFKTEIASNTGRKLPVRQFGGLGRANLRWRAAAASQLATLLTASVPLDRALRILELQSTKSWEKTVFRGLAKGVAAGQSLSSAVLAQGMGFGRDEIGLVEAGEHSGALAASLTNLSAMLEKRVQLRDKIISALIYPAFLLALAPISLLIIATVLVPNLAPLFEDSGAPMPFALKAMVWASGELRDRGLLWLVASGLTIAAMALAMRTAAARTAISALVNRLPAIGTIRQKIAAARICRTLGTLLHSGSPLQTALMTTANVVGSGASRGEILAARDKVMGGTKLAVALKDIGILTPSILQLVTVGEETNRLDAMLNYAAEREERIASDHIDRLMTLLTPLITVLLGLLIGGLVMSIMKAILAVNSLAIQ
jgi:general secretion pathway protein F